VWNNVVNALVFTAIAATSGIAGAMLVVPALAVGLTQGAMVASPDRRAWPNVAMGLGCFVIPLVGEWTGPYEFRPTEIAIHWGVLQLTETTARLAVLLVTVGVVISAALATRSAVRAEAETRRRWLLQLWHLRAMTAVDYVQR
jgi:hypothetical protein